MEYTIQPRVPGVRPQDPPDYDGVTFVYVFTKVTDPWTQPPVQGNVTLVVANNQGFVKGMTVAIESAGYYEVVSTDALNRMTVMNFGTNYNVAPGSGILPGKITTTSLPGPPGGIGPQGPQGIPGTPGPIGPPLNLKGTVPTVLGLPATGNTVNDMWNVISNGHAYGWTGSAWIDLGPFQGPAGPTGSTGPAGPQGPQGAQGNQGPTGPAGSPGSAGSMGPQGVPGPTGPQGVQGAIGPQGPKGLDGTSVVLKGSVANHAALPTTGNTLGDLWVTLDTGHGWVWSAGNVWADVGPIQGPPGATGATGPQGPQGATGTQGPQGNPGTTGAQGPAGSTGSMGPAGTAATVAVGTTTTGAPGSNAAVTNTGTPNAAVLAFTIPAGVAGATGPTGPSAWTLVGGSGFTVPAYGASITVAVADTSWMALGEWVYVDDSGGAGIAGQLVITAKTPTSVTLFNPTGSSYPLASSSNNGLMKQVSGLTSDFIDGTNNCQPIAPQIWNVRSNSYNSLGNPNFSVKQRNCGTSFIIPFNFTAPIEDRWFMLNNLATGRNSAQFAAGYVGDSGGRIISDGYFTANVTTAQASLAAGEVILLMQSIEGSAFREVSANHSLSLLVSSSVAGLKFAVSFRDGTAATKSLVKLCTIPSANTWTLITLPNLPAFPIGSGNWGFYPGQLGCVFTICLAAGSTFIAPAADTWQNGNFTGAPGMSNFAAAPVNSNFQVVMVQHEPGLFCSNFIDKPFTQNLDECQRYYFKTYDYSQPLATATFSGSNGSFYAAVNSNANGYGAFKKTMAKIPTVIIYNPATGHQGAIYRGTDGGEITGAAAAYPSQNSFLQITAALSAASNYIAQYVADTGW